MKFPFIIIVLSFLLTLFLFSNNACAEFKVNASQKAVYEAFHIIALGDISVGETAYINDNTLCIGSDGEIKIPKHLKIVSERTEYSSYFKVKRIPEDKITIELIPAKKESKSDRITEFIEYTVDKMSAIQCDTVYFIFSMTPEDMFIVDSVEGTTSIIELSKKLK